MQLWLENFAYRIHLRPLEFIVAAVLAFNIAMITVSYQALRSALGNPVNSLKYE
jgi:putative ABC transport system permease protein